MPVLPFRATIEPMKIPNDSKRRTLGQAIHRNVSGWDMLNGTMPSRAIPWDQMTAAEREQWLNLGDLGRLLIERQDAERRQQNPAPTEAAAAPTPLPANEG